MAQVKLQGVAKVYPGGIEAIAGIDLAVAEGEYLVIVGPSGSGKSTLLRLIAGLEPLTTGAIWIGGQRADHLPPAARDVAMVFQHPALYPHLSVFENLAFGLRARHRPEAEVRQRVAAMADLLGLSDVLGRRPRALSGGQRQRVALGRALTRRPAALLLDEPLSALDAPLRAATRAELADLHRRLGITILHVTHDQAEAMALGDRVAVLERGRIAQVGGPRELYDRPASRFVAAFIGSPPMNLLPGLLDRDGGQLRLRLDGVEPPVALDLPRGASWTAPLEDRPAGRIDLGLRPEHLHILAGKVGPLPSDEPMILGRVRRLEPLGHETLAELSSGPHTLRIRLDPEGTPQPGERLPLLLDLTRAIWFDPDSGRRLTPPSGP
ncbi:MAG: ATP-binding cassette domain-containing protein [Isosphaeraceae bacterium]|nr:ATP-binding cassette domain-containing protein [Isosphaeraceae bacterium]